MERQEEKEQKSYSERSVEQRDLVIEYICFCNDYLNEINVNFSKENISSKNNRVFKSIYEIKKQRSKVIASFVNQDYWEGITGKQSGLKNYFEFILEPKYLESGITNTVEYICSLVDNDTATEDFVSEIKILLDILSRLLSDINLKKSDKEKIKKFIEKARDNYFKNIERENNVNEKINFDILKNESIDDYYIRLFFDLENQFGNKASKNISGISGRLSFSNDVSWQSKITIKLGLKSIVLNTGIKDSEAIDVVKQVYYQIKYGLKKPESNQIVRDYVKSNLNSFINLPSFQFIPLKRIRKGFYFTTDKSQLGSSESLPLEFKDGEHEVWYMDMNLTKDEAYSILKNIVVGNEKYDKDL